MKKKKKKKEIKILLNKYDSPTSLIRPDPDADMRGCEGNGRHFIYFATGASANSMTTIAINIDTAIVIVAQE